MKTFSIVLFCFVLFLVRFVFCFFNDYILCTRYLFGMHAFGLEETNFYREAEKEARKVGTVCIAKFVP